MKKNGLDRAIEAAGGISALARGLNRTRQAVQQWARIPAELVLEVEKLTGVPRTKLRPDLYPEEAA